MASDSFGSADLTRLLRRAGDGDEDALESLLPLVYDELRLIARRQLSHQAPGQTLNTTALVHEVFLKLVGRVGGAWPGRAHFYAFASRAMRHILVDAARHRRAQRRGGDAVRVVLHDGMMPNEQGFDDVLEVDEAVRRLAERHPRMAQVVELRFFGGLAVPEVAEVLDTSVRTVEREWTRAKAYLLEELGGDEAR